MTETNEIWLPIPEHPFYDVSNMGRVRSWIKSGGKGGGTQQRETPLILKPKYHNGYQHITITQKSKDIHMLVMLAFVGPRPDGLDVCHGNGNPADNRLENLRYGTRSENMRDALRHGTINTLKLTSDQVREIRARYVKGQRPYQYELAAEYGVSQPMIGYITRGDSWVSEYETRLDSHAKS